MNVINKKKLLNLVVLLAIFFFTSGVINKAHAAISFIGATPDTTPTSINVPAGYQAGDVMIAVFSIDRASTTTDPAITATGWTAINSVANTNGGSTSPRTLTAAYWKIAGASETSYNFSITSEGVGAILVYRGVDNSNPTTGTATGQSVGSAASLQNSYSAASITTGFANSWLVHVTGVESTSTKNFTVPSGWTNERVDTGSTTPDTWIGVSDFQQNSAGASGAKAATLTSAATAFGSTVMFALRPENVAPSITVSPTASYPQYTRTGANNTPWQLTFTATDPEQTGANALTYYVHTGANRTGTQIATATFTSGTGVDTTVAYNATGMASGTNTLYLSVYDGQSYSSNPTFTVLRDDAAPSSAGTISTTPNPVGDDNIYSVTFTPTDALSTATNEIRYWITTTSGAPNGTEVTTGGTAIANGENLPNEGKDKAFDDNTGTKWLVFATTGYIGYDFSAETTEVVNRYTLTSGNDSPDRDPKNWDFQGSNNGTDWTTLDSQTNQVFASRAQTKEYNFANTTPYKMYRLNVTANNGSSNIIQLAELSMYKNANGLTYGTSTSGAQKTTSTFTDSTLTDGATRYVRLCDGASNCADFSFTVAKGNPPTVSTLSTSNLTPYTATLNAQANPVGAATTGYFRYWTSDPGSCTDSGGTRAPASSGTSLGSGNSPVGYSQNITGLTPGVTYYYCAIANNGSTGYGTVTSFTAPGGGQCASVPQSGNYTMSSSCVFPDSSNDGVDGGTGTTNTAQMTINATKTLTVGPGQTVSYGSINKSGASIIKFGGGILMKAPVWIPDNDEDDYPNAASIANQVVSFTRPAGYMRRAVANGLAADCNANDADVFVNVANTGVDADQDGYRTGSTGTNCVGASTTLSGRTYYKNASGSYGYITSATELGSTDCSDSDAAKWQNITGYSDTDGDGFGAGGSSQVCSGASLPAGYSANNTDCASSDGTKWQNLTGYTDADGDGVRSSSSVQVCSGASLPAGYSGTPGTDCKDTGTSANQVWVVKTCYIDLDGDTYINGSKTCTNNATCTSATRASTGSANDVTTYTAGRLLNASTTTDCDDSSSNVNPGQTSFFTTQGTNGWDYNCNGSDDKQSSGLEICNTTAYQSFENFPGCGVGSGTQKTKGGQPACGGSGSSSFTSACDRSYYSNADCTGDIGLCWTSCSGASTQACR